MEPYFCERGGRKKVKERGHFGKDFFLSLTLIHNTLCVIAIADASFFDH
jgi:hypothetical protein